jgi:hypothetical protein
MICDSLQQPEANQRISVIEEGAVRSGEEEEEEEEEESVVGGEVGGGNIRRRSFHTVL